MLSNSSACLLPFPVDRLCGLTCAVGQRPGYTQALQGAVEAVLWLQSVPLRSSSPCPQHSLLLLAGYSWCLPPSLAACTADYCHDRHPQSHGCHRGTATYSSGGRLQSVLASCIWGNIQAVYIQAVYTWASKIHRPGRLYHIVAVCCQSVTWVRAGMTFDSLCQGSCSFVLTSAHAC